MPWRGELTFSIYRLIYHLNRVTLTFFKKMLISEYTGHKHTKTQFLLYCHILALIHVVASTRTISNYTGISLMGCDELKAPLLFCIVHHLRIEKKSENPIILRMGWTTITLPDSFLSFVWQHNLLSILYNFFFAFFSFKWDLHPSYPLLEKCLFFAKDITFINLPLTVVKCSLANQGNASNIVIAFAQFLRYHFYAFFVEYLGSIHHSETMNTVLFKIIQTK